MIVSQMSTTNQPIKNQIKNKKSKIKKKKMKTIILASILLLSTSCATIISGRYDSIIINSEPPNADVYLENQKIGTTGTAIQVKRKYDNYSNFSIKKDGYSDFTLTAKKKIDGWFYLGAFPLTFGIPCWIDIATGAAVEYKEKTHNVILQPIQPAKN